MLFNPILGRYGQILPTPPYIPHDFQVNTSNEFIFHDFVSLNILLDPLRPIFKKNLRFWKLVKIEFSSDTLERKLKKILKIIFLKKSHFFNLNWNSTWSYFIFWYTLHTFCSKFSFFQFFCYKIFVHDKLHSLTSSGK